MSDGETNAEIKRRFDEAERIRVGDTYLRRTALRPDADSLRRHFAGSVGRAPTEVKNPHIEPKITVEERARTIPASVLLAIVLREPEPTVLVTQRHHKISHPGQWVFPGGRADKEDASPFATALREAEEEIGLDPSRVEVLGRLGDYYSHTGFCIAPAIALVHPPFDLTPHPAEVEAIAEVPLSRIVDSYSYFLYQFEDREDRAHFGMDSNAVDPDLVLTGVTASICIGLYSDLLKTHTAEG